VPPDPVTVPDVVVRRCRQTTLVRDTRESSAASRRPGGVRDDHGLAIRVRQQLVGRGELMIGVHESAHGGVPAIRAVICQAWFNCGCVGGNEVE
jgi:hypothetical protein